MRTVRLSRFGCAWQKTELAQSLQAARGCQRRSVLMRLVVGTGDLDQPLLMKQSGDARADLQLPWKVCCT